MHPRDHQFNDDPRDHEGNHASDWTPESFEEFTHEASRKRPDHAANDARIQSYLEEAAGGDKPPF